MKPMVQILESGSHKKLIQVTKVFSNHQKQVIFTISTILFPIVPQKQREEEERKQNC